MEISAALTANLAVVDENGLLHVQGGGWEYASAHTLPWTVTGYIAGIVEFGAKKLGSQPPLLLKVESDGGQDRGSSGSITIDANRQRAAFAIPFAIAVNEEAILTATLLTLSGSELASLSFPVRHTPPPPIPGD